MTIDRLVDVRLDLMNSVNTITENALGAAWAYGTEVPDLNGATLTGNDVDQVVVYPNVIEDSEIWPATTYRVLRLVGGVEAFRVRGGELTLQAGTTLRIESDQKILVRGGGGLSAVGTVDAPITLTSADPQSGHWGGLAFIDTDNPMNRLEHVIVEYAGGNGFGTADQSANVVVTHGTPVRSKVAILNTTLRASNGYGLFVRGGSSLSEFENKTLTGNMAGPAYVGAPAVDGLGSSSTYKGNTVDVVTVATGSGMEITEDAIWQALDVPYYLKEEIGLETIVSAALTIEPGVIMEMAPGVGISMRNGGSMTAEGTEMNRIVMRSSGAGAWKGLDFSSTTGSLDYIDILDAGSNSWGGVAEAGAVTIRATSDHPATVFATGNVSVSGSSYATAFSYGPSIEVGCVDPIYIPPPDQVADHCRPPQ